MEIDNEARISQNVTTRLKFWEKKSQYPGSITILQSQVLKIKPNLSPYEMATIDSSTLQRTNLKRFNLKRHQYTMHRIRQTPNLKIGEIRDWYISHGKHYQTRKSLVKGTDCIYKQESGDDSILRKPLIAKLRSKIETVFWRRMNKCTYSLKERPFSLALKVNCRYQHAGVKDPEKDKTAFTSHLGIIASFLCHVSNAIPLEHFSVARFSVLWTRFNQPSNRFLNFLSLTTLWYSASNPNNIWITFAKFFCSSSTTKSRSSSKYWAF